MYAHMLPLLAHTLQVQKAAVAQTQAQTLTMSSRHRGHLVSRALAFLVGDVSELWPILVAYTCVYYNYITAPGEPEHPAGCGPPHTYIIMPGCFCVHSCLGTVHTQDTHARLQEVMVDCHTHNRTHSWMLATALHADRPHTTVEPALQREDWMSKPMASPQAQG